ncbi:MAG: lytic transglycosylase domain-containing protein [Proteobacteria bacterium]|nr:lytic transglycosylase domain-containing protein [Pseudomonadota bacterium]
MHKTKKLVLLAVALICAPAMALAESALPPNDDGGASSARIRVLSPEDVRLYRAIFEDERTGNFAQADADVAKLGDTSLMGYVRAEHTLSPHSKRTPLTLLNDWLREFGDLSIANRIYNLAAKRARRSRSAVAGIPGFAKRGGGYEDSDIPDLPLSSAGARAIQPKVDAAIRNSNPAEAQAIVQGLVGYDPPPPSDIARLVQKVAASYIAEGLDQQAYDYGSTQVSSASAPLLYWYVGFAAYRMGNYADAAKDFEALAQVGSVPSWTRGQAAFWAARAYGALGQPLKIVSLLTAAAREQPTFYGILAERVLGVPGSSTFAEPDLDASNFLALMQVPAAHRAVALWQVGRLDEVPNEMNRALAAIDLKLGGTYAAVARKMGLPNLELRASETAASRGEMLSGLYPIPVYLPEGGYRVDPSLVLAFARIESRFKPDETSYAGARGLMQLMPGTATHVAQGNAGDLGDPAHNMYLGQLYLMELLDDCNGNLVEVAASYNAGPGNLTRWMSKPGTQADPLLFMESIPISQTRNYVKRVMMYHWMYGRRLGQDTPSLDQTARGDWPLYDQRKAVPRVPIVKVTDVTAATH